MNTCRPCRPSAVIIHATIFLATVKHAPVDGAIENWTGGTKKHVVVISRLERDFVR